MISRRHFIASLGALAGAAACARSQSLQAAGSVASSRRRLDRIGIQLYTVRQAMRQDMPGTLARIAGMGYREVEFAGYFGRSPAEVRALLDANKLTAPSTHLDFNSLRGPELGATLDAARVMGHEFVATAWIDASLRRTRADWSAVAREFNRIGQRAKQAGLRFAFHNHEYEFVRVDGAIPYDILLAETDPAFVDFEMDIFWLTKGGGDPKAYFREHPSRFTMLHVKDSGGPPTHPQVDVGTGVIDFAGILRLDADQRHAVRHVFVEHDQPEEPFEFSRKAFTYLSTLEY
jgi:sugar phosphate isomerase/epimerase